jgi:hypothetical protein
MKFLPKTSRAMIVLLISTMQLLAILAADLKESWITPM